MTLVNKHKHYCCNDIFHCHSSRRGSRCPFLPIPTQMVPLFLSPLRAPEAPLGVARSYHPHHLLVLHAFGAGRVFLNIAGEGSSWFTSSTRARRSRDICKQSSSPKPTLSGLALRARFPLGKTKTETMTTPLYVLKPISSGYK